MRNSEGKVVYAGACPLDAESIGKEALEKREFNFRKPKYCSIVA
jgi:hypothetical protein